MIKHIEVEGFRGLSGKVSLDLAKLNIFVGRNNTGKSSILEAVSLSASCLNDYKDALGRNLLEDILLRDKKIKLEYIVNTHARDKIAHINVNLDSGHEISLSIKLYKDLEELLHYNEFAYNCLSEWFKKNVVKIIDRLIESLIRKLSEIPRRSWFYLLSPESHISVDKLLMELKDLERAILEKEPHDAIISRIEKIISLIEHEYGVSKLFGEIVYNLRPKLFDEVYKGFQQLIRNTGFLIFELKIDNEVVKIDWTPLKTVGLNWKEISRKLAEILTTEILNRLKRFRPISEALIHSLLRDILSELHFVDFQLIFRPELYSLALTFRSGSLHTVYSLIKPGRREMKILYLPHRGIWRFEDIESMFSKIFREDLKADVLKVLEEIQVHEKVKDLSIVKEEEGYRLELLSEHGSLPLYILGDGYVSLLRTIFAHVLAGREAIVLIEEPETSLHPGYMAIYSRICLSSIKNFNQQIFISTHSLELLEYLLMEAEDHNMLSEIKVFRLEREGSKNYVREYDGYEALKELEEIKEDLRGV